MKTASKSDKPLVIAILKRAFHDVPGLQWITGNGPDHTRKLEILLDASVELTLHQGQIWLSDDEQACCLFFYPEQRRLTPIALYHYARMVLQVIGLRRLPEILARERYIRAHQPTDQACLYVWYIAAQADKSGMEAIVDIKNGLFRKAYLENRAITMETTQAQVATVFERYGFDIAHTWQPATQKIGVWFLRREPSLDGVTLPVISQKTLKQTC
jgi:hypothetical protein